MALNLVQSSGIAFSQIARDSRSSGSASDHFAWFSRFRPSQARSPAQEGAVGLSVLRRCASSSRRRGSASAQRPSDSYA